MKLSIRLLISALTYLALETSCSKKHDDAAPAILPDTLTTGWTKITSLPKADFRDVFFPDNNTGYACGASGIYRSTDGGTNWSMVNSAKSMVNIGAANSNRVCFVGNGPKPYFTQDAGNSFYSTEYFTPNGAVGFNDCYFPSLDTCYLSSGKYLWRSVNGGEDVDTLFHFDVGTSSAALFFLNDQLGWILREDGIYKTADAGINWNLMTSLTTAAGGMLCFVNENDGYRTAYGTVYKTSDGGLNWTPVFTPPIPDYGDLAFVNINEGFCCFGNRIYKTIDAGANWMQVAALGNEKFVEIHFTDAAHGWACTTDGVILRFNQ